MGKKALCCFPRPSNPVAIIMNPRHNIMRLDFEKSFVIKLYPASTNTPAAKMILSINHVFLADNITPPNSEIMPVFYQRCGHRFSFPELVFLKNNPRNQIKRPFQLKDRWFVSINQCASSSVCFFINVLLHARFRHLLRGCAVLSAPTASLPLFGIRPGQRSTPVPAGGRQGAAESLHEVPAMA